MSFGSYMIGEVGPLRITGQAGLGLGGPWAKWAMGPSSSGSTKDHSTHNALLFPGWNFYAFVVRETTVF